MKVPCKNCLMIPACKHKYYEELIFSCRLMSEYVSLRDERRKSKDGIVSGLYLIHKKRVKKLVETLKPTKWMLNGTSPTTSGYSIKILEDNDNKIHWASTFF